MFPKRLKPILFPSILVLLFFAASILLLHTILQNSSVQKYLLGRLSNAAGYDIRAKKIDISLWRGIGISAYDLIARSREGRERIAASWARVTIDVGELIKGHIVPSDVFLSHPKIELAIKKGWRFSGREGQTFYKDLLFQKMATLRSLSVEDGEVYIKDLAYDLQDLYLNFTQIPGDTIALAVRLRGKIHSNGSTASCKVEGTIRQKSREHADIYAELKLEMGQLPLTWIPWPDAIDAKEGRVKAQVDLRGTLGRDISAEGRLFGSDLNFTLLKSDREKVYSLPHLALDFGAHYSDRILQISRLRANGSDFSLGARMDLDLRKSPNSYISLELNGPFMPSRVFKGIFPDPLVPTWVGNRLFPVLSGGEVRLDRFSLKGALGRIKRIGRPENANCLLMEITLRGIEVFKDEDILPFKDLYAKVSLKNGGLGISGVKAGFGESIIKGGTADIQGLFRHAVTYDVWVDGLFHLEDLCRQRELALLPSDLRKQLHRFREATGNLEAQIKFHHEKGWSYPRILAGQFRFDNCLIMHKSLHLPMSLDDAWLKIDEEGRKQFWGTGLWGKSHFQGSGFAETSQDTLNAYLVGRGDMDEILDYFCQGKEGHVQFKGLAGYRLSVSKKKDLWSCLGELGLGGVTMGTSSFVMKPGGSDNKISFGAEIRAEKKVRLRYFRCRLGGSTFEASGSYGLEEREPFHLTLLTKRFDLEDLGIWFKRPNKSATGMLMSHAEVEGFLKDFSITSVTGEMEAKDLSLVLGGLPSPINDCDLKVKFSGKQVSLTFLDVKVGQSPIHMQGDFRGWDGLKGELRVNAKYLNLSDLIADFTGPGAKEQDASASGFIDRSEIHLRLSVLKGKWKDLKFGPLEAESVFRSGNIFIKPTSVQMEHGILKFRGHVKGGKSPELVFSVYTKMTNQPAPELLKALGVRERYLEGDLNLEAVLFTRGREIKDLIPDLSGSANIVVENGRINKSSVVFKILDFLSLQNIFSKRLTDFSKEGLDFEKIKGHIAINRGVLNTEDLIMKSPVFNAAAKGSLDLGKEWVDLEVGTEPLGTADLVISKIPDVTYILSGKEGTILIYYFRVKGPLSKPDVKYIPLKNLRREVVGFFKRLLLTPGRVFSRMSDMTKDYMEGGDPVPEGEFGK